jgi:hypothetical protein
MAKARGDHRPFGKLEQDDPGVERSRAPTTTCRFPPVANHRSRLGQIAAAKGQHPEHLVVVPAWASALRCVVAEDARHALSDRRNDLVRRPNPLIAGCLNGRGARALALSLVGCRSDGGAARDENESQDTDENEDA